MSLTRKLVGSLVRATKRVGVVDRWITRLFQFWYDLPVPPTHYYSPLPNVAALRTRVGRWYSASEMPGITLDVAAQSQLLHDLSRYRGECAALPSFADVQRSGYGPGFGEVEAHLLYCIVRHFGPRNIIEIGSGTSTFFALQGIEANSREGQLPTTLTCIEPYPMSALKTLVERNHTKLIVSEVQDVSPVVFSELSDRDILFVDSSHVSKTDSDVNYLYLEVLPRLKPGVIVHIHDISFPYLTFPPQHPLFAHSILWNESAMVRAFLSFNAAFEIMMCQSYLHHRAPQLLETAISIYDPTRHFPASLWLRRLAD
jgi:hypothetical protein